MTGMEAMANNLIKSISGMTIDEIKQQAQEAQKKVIEFIEMVNTNFQALATMIRTSSDNNMKAHQLLVTSFATINEATQNRLNAIDERILDISVCMYRLKEHISQFEIVVFQLDSKLDKIRLDIAQLLCKEGVALDDDLIQLLTEQATMSKSNGRTNLIVIPPLTEQPRETTQVFGSPESGVEPANSTQPNPAHDITKCDHAECSDEVESQNARRSTN